MTDKTIPAVGKLKRYLKRKKLSANAFALEHRMSSPEVSKILRGDRYRISVEQANAFEVATEGEITMHDWIPR